MVDGACLGLATGMVIAVVENIRALTQSFAGDRLALGLYLFAFLGSTGALTGGAAALWLVLGAQLSTKIPGRAVAGGTFTLWASAPLAGFLAWVPWRWVTGNWAVLTESQQIVVVAIYLGMLGFALAVAYVSARVHAACTRAPGRLPRAHGLLVVVFLGLAAGSYWADATIYPALYADFHAGLAGSFVLSVGALCALVHCWLSCKVRLSKSGSSRLALSARLLVIALTGSLIGAEWIRPNIFDKSGTLVFGKMLRLARAVTDFDRDGASSFFGGSDCAGFDARSGEGQLDLPANGVDEDCSGRDARWPPPLRLPPPERSAKHLNLILITVDSLRADHLSAYGYQRNTSPEIAAWAEGAWRFARASSQDTKTWESVSSMFTGLYPSNLPRDYTHPRTRGAKEYVFYLSRDTPVLTELLQAQGYRTRAVSMLGLVRTIGLDRGFERFSVTRKAIATASRFLKRVHSPFFLWVHLQWPHNPYRKHRGYDFGDSPIDRYDSEVAFTDAQIGRLLALVKKRRLDRNTVIVLTSDHGEEFGEHGGFYHGGAPYRVQTHVPLIIQVPDETPAVIETPVELVDLMPTFCELIGFQTTCDGFDGQSLLATVAGKRSPDYPGAYVENYHRYEGVQRRALYVGDWRLIQDLSENRLELYDTRSDPGEQRNVARENPQILEGLLEQLVVRPLRRSAALLATRNPAPDSDRLLSALPLIRQDFLLALALDRIAESQLPETRLTPALTRLLARPDLSAMVREKAQALIEQRPTAKP